LKIIPKLITLVVRPSENQLGGLSLMIGAVFPHPSGLVSHVL